jgi:hypothetical protein
MNEKHPHDCERFETMMASWFDDDAITASDRDALTAHIASCVSCRESFELSAQMEQALVSRSSLVPAVDGFLPAFAPAHSPFEHPRLVAVFRAMMSPAGIAIALVMWSTLLTLHFREPIASALIRVSPDRFTIWLQSFSGSLINAAGGDAYTLIAIYVAVALAVLASTGAITLKYIRHS